MNAIKNRQEQGCGQLFWLGGGADVLFVTNYCALHNNANTKRDRLIIQDDVVIFVCLLLLFLFSLGGGFILYSL